LTGRDLRLIRQRLRLTQKELATRLGIARGTVNRYERGKISIPEPTARLARTLR